MVFAVYHRGMSVLGRALAYVARAPVPIIAAERYSTRQPEPGSALPETSPLCATCDRLEGTGPLGGDAVVVKDQLDVAGLPTGVGLADAGPPVDRDATIVTRVLAAGGRVIGKAKMTELGVDGLGTLMHYAIPSNPRARGYVPGGSSTGTAVAVASGLARWGIGGDGLGSVRIPAAFCGLYGLRPGRTTLPRDGIRTPVRSLDAIGPITRTAADCATLYQVMAGTPVEALAAEAPRRIGLPILGGPMRVARPVWRALQRMLTALGTEVVPVRVPSLECVCFVGGMTGAYELAHGPYAGRATTGAGRRSYRLGRMFSANDFARLDDTRQRMRDTTATALAQAGILAMPTTAFAPPALTPATLTGKSTLSMLRALAAFTPLANLCDLPSLSAPMGVDDRGRPLSIMFVGPPGSESQLLRIALAVEKTGLGTTPVVL